jgi:AcrR family transcriptional regulator
MYIAQNEKARYRQDKHSCPPGKRKLMDALRYLLGEKHFNAITTAEISHTADTNEALIYRYFGDKRGLLHQVLTEYLKETHEWISSNISDIEDPVKRLERIIWAYFDVYNRHRVFAKIVIVEVRNFPGYFESETYQLIKNYARFLLENINEAVKNGQFRNDLDPRHIRNVIIGAMEHLVLPDVIFERKIDPDAYTKVVCDIVFNGIAAKKMKKSTNTASKVLP